MGERIIIYPNKQAVLLYNSTRECWEDKSDSLSAIYKAYYYGNHTGFDIYFRGGTGKFFYKSEKVKFLSKIQSVDIRNLDVIVEEYRVDARQVEAFEQGYFRVRTSVRIYFGKQVKFINNRYREIYKYFKLLAGYASEVAEDNTPLSFLSQNYLRLSDDVLDSVLGDYLQGKIRSYSHKDRLILPFDFNQSQVNAITIALQNNISVIEGPPGTGKTQTIINLIANIVYAGKSCAVISNNNTAVKNVYEKLEEENLSFLAASLGSRANVLQFFDSDQNSKLSEYLEKEIMPISEVELKRIDVLAQKIKKIQEVEVETAILESELIDLQYEKRYYSLVSGVPAELNANLSSATYLSMMLRLQESRKLWFYEKWLMSLRLRFKKWYLLDINQLITSIEQLYYISKTKELINNIESKKNFLISQDKKKISEDLKILYRKAFNSFVYQYYRNQTTSSYKADNYKSNFNGFIQRFPVVLSTTHSLQNNILRYSPMFRQFQQQVKI